MTGFYASVPTSAVFDREVKNTDLRVLCALAAHAKPDGRCWPATTLIAQKLGVTDRHVRDCLRKLEQRGHIQTEHRPGKSSVYQIVFSGPNPGTYTSGDPGTPTSGVETNPGTPTSAPPEPILPGTPEPMVPPNTTKNNTKEQEGSIAKDAKAKKYVFEGKTIKLNQSDFDAWAKRYDAIPSLEIELEGLDDWYQTEKGKRTLETKRWFDHTKGCLRKKQQEQLAKKDRADSQPEPEARYNDGVY